jgi:membrane-associated protease RseP (regulator of RpoE activity)
MTFWLFFIPAFLILTLTHTFGMALAGKLIGAWVLEVSLFLGPKLFQFDFGGTRFTVRALPLGGFVKFWGMGTPEDDMVERELPLKGEIPFRDVHPLKRMAVPIFGLSMLVVIGFIGLGFANVIGSVGRGFFQILSGAWSPGTVGKHYIGLLVAASQALAFHQFLGLLACKMLAVNLMPLSVLNGGQILLWFFEMLFKIPETAIQKINLASFFINLLVYCPWLWAIFRYLTT